MALSHNLQKLLDQAKTHDSYWVEKAKLDFALALEKRRKDAKMSYKDIAARIASSAAYITKVFRGDSNLTIESMVKLAHATGGRVNISISDERVQQVPAYTLAWTGGARFIGGRSHTSTTQAASVQTADVKATEEAKAA